MTVQKQLDKLKMKILRAIDVEDSVREELYNDISEIEKGVEILLSDRDLSVFIEVVENPKEPNEALKKAAEDYFKGE